MLKWSVTDDKEKSELDILSIHAIKIEMHLSLLTASVIQHDILLMQ